jgi:hypothetical protein
VTAATLTLTPPDLARTADTAARAAAPDARTAELEARAAVLAAGCALRLQAITRLGGPAPDLHLEELRRMLVRREGRRTGATRRRQIRHALAAASSGRPGAIRPADGPALVRDLAELHRALGTAVRVGAASDRLLDLQA